MKQQIQKDLGGPLTFRPTDPNDPNRPVTVTSPQVLITSPGGATLVALTGTGVSQDTNTKELSYTLSADDSATAALNYKIRWSYSYGARTFYHSRLFDIVRTPLTISIDDGELLRELPQLADLLGKAQGGSTTTLINPQNLVQADDYWNGATLHILGGACKGEKRSVSDFDSATGTLTVSPAFSAAIDETSSYALVQRDFSHYIERAFERIMNRLIQAGRRPDLILESRELASLHIYLSLSLICRAFSRDEGDHWWRLSQAYAEDYAGEWDRLTLNYDANEDSLVDAAERDTVAERPEFIR